MTPLVETDASERLCKEDMAARTEAEFLARALLLQRMHAARSHSSVPGVCLNCQVRCLPLAVYCDEYCQSDHEARERSTARMRTSLG